uniref:Testis-specific Y-encoded protein 3-like n=1 Tax=Ursus americanus TaxID=9643 RepID=A0A452R628_URSAM
MESAAGSGEGGAAPPSCTTLVLEGGREASGPHAQAGAWGEAGPLQTLGAAGMGAEAVVGAEAQQGREQAGPGDELVLVVDIMVAEEGQKEEEAQEKQEGEEQPEARRGPSLSPLEALGALQSELEPVNKQASRSYSRLKLKSCQRRQRHLEHRSAIIRGIPGFWAKFVNHPQMSAMISEVAKCRHILLFFRKNSYFRNEVVVKEYVVSAAGYGPSHSPPIQWHQDFEREAHSRRHHNSSLNFFNWFSDHSFAGASRIAEIIMDDLWPNPLQYYVSKKAAGEGTERTTGEEPRAWAPRRVLSGSLGPGLHKGRH